MGREGSLSIWRQGDAILTQATDEGIVEIRAVGADRFMTVDGSVTLRFERDALGCIRRLVLVFPDHTCLMAKRSSPEQVR